MPVTAKKHGSGDRQIFHPHLIRARYRPWSQQRILAQTNNIKGEK
jgi:hypothetical protein